MFIGHFAVALASKKVAPRTSLGTLILAAQWLDLLWPLCLLLGWETVRVEPGITRFSPFDFVSYPYTHSLVAACMWACLLGVVYFVARRSVRAALVVAAVVLSHWVLDWITHRPDLPIGLHGPKVGLGLWNSVAATLVVEFVMFAAGVALYLATTEAKDRVGSIALWALLVFLVVMYLGSSFSAGTPTQKQIGWGGLLMWLFVPWGYWIDNGRKLGKKISA